MKLFRSNNTVRQPQGSRTWLARPLLVTALALLAPPPGRGQDANPAHAGARIDWPQAKAEQYKSCLRDAAAAEAAGRRLEAIRRLEAAISLEPKRYEAHLQRAQLLLKSERYEEAIAGFQRSIDIDLRLYDAWVGMGKAETGLGRYAHAVGHLRHATELMISRPEAHKALGEAYLKAERYVEADEAYKEAIKEGPMDPEVFAGYAMVLRYESLYNLAYNYANTAVEMARGQKDRTVLLRTLQARADILRRLQRIGEAMNDERETEEIEMAGSQ